MKPLQFACCVVALFLSMVLLLAGCGAASSPNSAGPASPPAGSGGGSGGSGGGSGGGGGGGGSSPHGTFVYVRNNPLPTGSTSAFRMNTDGTLTALQGSPFSISGALAVGGSFLLVSNNKG